MVYVILVKFKGQGQSAVTADCTINNVPFYHILAYFYKLASFGCDSRVLRAKVVDANSIGGFL